MLLEQLMDSSDKLQAASAELESAGHLLKKAKSNWLPRLDARTEAGHEDIDKPTGSTSELRNTQTLTVTQKIYDFGETSGEIESYRAHLDEVKAKHSVVRQEVIIEGITAYLKVIKEREKLKYARKSEKSIRELSGMQQALVERGAALSYEELQVKGQLAAAQSNLVTVKRELQKARNNFRAVFGFRLSDEQVEKLKAPALPSQKIPESLREAITVAHTQNPALVELKHAVQRKRGDLEKNKSAFYPKMNLKLDGKRRENDDGLDGVRWENRATVEVSYNLFSGFSDTENVKAQNQDIIATRKSLVDRQRSVEEEVRNAWIELETLKENIQLLSAQADITWEFLRLIKKKKAVGSDVNLLDILVGERDYIQATSARVSADMDELIAGYTLLHKMGIINEKINSL